MDSQNGYRQWNVPQGPRAVLLLVHGLGAHSGRWDAMGNFFAHHNVASYAVECPDCNNFGGEITRLNTVISMANPGKKVFLVGESLGALASLMFVYKRPELFNGLICISPAFKSKLKFPALDYIKIFLSLIHNPGKEYHLPFDLSMCTRDKDFINSMENDPHEHRSATSSSLVKILLAQYGALSQVRNIDVPTLFLIAGSDLMVSPDASIKAFHSIKAKDKTIIEYPDMYHALSIDTGKEQVFKDLLGWIENRI